MTTPALQPQGINAVGWLYVLAFILLVALIAGREVIGWLLMKLYEFFIQRNPLSI